MRRQRFYAPTDRGAEAAIAERLKRWEALRAKKAQGGGR
jgi:putative ATPase